jgi:ATP-binding cassette subfamily F protein uup
VSHDRDFLDRIATSILMPEGNGKWIEYAGGYSDMLAQRGAGVEARRVKIEGPRPAVTGAAPPARSQRKLSFNDKHALQTLPERIDKLHAEIASLEAALLDHDLFTRDPARFDRTISRIAAARSELSELEDLWLELEMKREELEGA